MLPISFQREEETASILWCGGVRRFVCIKGPLRDGTFEVWLKILQEHSRFIYVTNFKGSFQRIKHTENPQRTQSMTTTTQKHADSHSQ